MRLDLKEFAQAVRSLHQQTDGGVKRTRLMLHVRPYQTRKIFLLKATDGRVTITTRIEHQGQLKQVESIVSDFVTECTKASVPVPSATAVAAGAGAGHTSQLTTAIGSGAAPSAAQSLQEDSGAPNMLGGGGKPVGKYGAKSSPGATAAAVEGSTTAVPSSPTSGKKHSGKKGRRH